MYFIRLELCDKVMNIYLLCSYNYIWRYLSLKFFIIYYINVLNKLFTHVTVLFYLVFSFFFRKVTRGGLLMRMDFGYVYKFC